MVSAAEFFIKGGDSGEGETDSGKNLSQRQRGTRGSGIKLSPASSSRHFVVLTCTRTRHRVAERG